MGDEHSSRDPDRDLAFRDPDGDLERFGREHGGWLARIPTGPLYCLPGAMIARLALPHLRRPPVLDGSAAAAERALLALCGRYGAVGFDAARPILYPHLAPRPPRPTPDAYPDLGWSRAHWLEIDQLIARADRVSERLKGYAGWLATEPAFLATVGELEARWRSLPDGQRPGFPLERATLLLALATGAGSVPEAFRAFAADFGVFCDRWGLIGLASWDLPEPQGPLLPSVQPDGAPALPAHGVHLVLPVHYPLAGDDDLMGAILREQRAKAAGLGLDASLAGLPHHRAYARILEVVHLERTATGRYAGTRRPPGLVGALSGAIAEALGLSAERIRRLRQAIAACRRGRREAVAKFGVRD